ncbi:MAG: hypothetical protein IPJ49_29180 [Candidatus Obscuribacter sp.]|jgi:phage tail tape-measure protein|nr:hypothetical protein [Candidatus Obscuribacter sp.]
MSYMITINNTEFDLIVYLTERTNFVSQEANNGANSDALRKEYSDLAKKLRSLMSILVYDEFRARTSQFQEKVVQLKGLAEEVKRRLDSLERAAQTAATIAEIAKFVDQSLAIAAGIAF